MQPGDAKTVLMVTGQLVQTCLVIHCDTQFGFEKVHHHAGTVSSMVYSFDRKETIETRTETENPTV